MSSIPVQIPQPSPEPAFRLSVAQYHAMIDSGILTDDDPVELLEGVLVFKMPKKPHHRIALAKLHRVLATLIPATSAIQLQEPITLADGEPEPDAAIIRGKPEDYTDRHPGPSDVLLVVEVADTTLARDRGVKLRSYARARISDYWIVDLTTRTVECYGHALADAPEPSYRERRVYTLDERVAVLLDGVVVGQFAVADVLP